MRQAARELEEIGLRVAAGVDADVGVDRQPRGLVGDERVVLLAQVAGEGEVRARLHERHIGRHGRVVRPAILAIDRADRRDTCALRGLVRGSAVEVAGLEDLVRLVVAVAGIDRANDRELVEHRRLLGQVLAEEHAGQPGGDDAERAAVLQRPVGLGVPGVDVARPAGHPEQDDALAPASGRPASAARARSRSSSGTLSPAMPARPALSMLRRLTTASPSRSRALRPPKACWWLCGCRSVVPMSSSGRADCGRESGRSRLARYRTAELPRHRPPGMTHS